MEAADARSAIEAAKEQLFGEMVTAIPVDAIEGFYNVRREHVVDAETAAARLEAAAAAMRDASVAGVLSVQHLHQPNIGDLNVRPLVTVERTQDPVDVVVSRVEDREENHYPENSTLAKGPPRCRTCGWRHDYDAECGATGTTPTGSEG